MLKKMFLSISLVLALFMTTPQSHAGLGIGLIAGNPAGGAARGAMITGAIVLVPSATFVTIALLGGAGELGLIGYVGFIFSPLIIGGGTLLNIDASLSKDKLHEVLQTMYPFIDNQEAIENLTGALKLKLTEFAMHNPYAEEAFVALTREEVEAALETATISNAQLDKIVSDLE